MTATTGRDALAGLRALAALYQEQRDLLLAAAPDLDRVDELAARIDGAVAAMPAPDRLIDVDESCLEELKGAAQALAELHRQAAAALIALHARHAAQPPVDHAGARAYARTGAGADGDAGADAGGPRFLDQRR
ncbi:MAG TPA: hypothetical protein VEL07_21330 [Planctomycetota bacterium]|nr:hypothetical protein [Planctomycetota bacterium]